jgi:iron complex outermembrane recepter protein
VWSYSLSALGRLSQTQVDPINNDRAFVAPALTWRPDADTRVTLLTYYQRDNTKGSEFLPYRGTVVPTAFGYVRTSRYTGEPKFGLFDREQFGLGYDAERRLSDVFSVRQNLRYQQTTIDWKQTYGNGLRADDRTLNRIDFNDDRTLTSIQVDTAGEARFSTGPLRHTLLFGVDYQRLRLGQIQSSRTGAPLDLFAPRYTDVLGAFPLPYLNSRQTLDQVGVYLQDQIRLGERWVLTAGARGDFTDQETSNRNTGRVTSQEDRQPTWRVGLVYLGPFGLAPYASYSTSFLPTIGTDASGNPFVPRTADQYEVGLRWQPPGYASFVQAAAFQITQQNTLTVNPAAPQFQVQTGEVRVRGAELEAVASLPGRGLNLIGSVTYLDPEITSSNRAGEEGTRPAGVPKTTASLYLDKSFDEGDGALAGLGVGAGVRYVGNTATQNGRPHQVVPSATLVDAALRYDLGRLGPDFRGAQLALNVSNLFDKRYVSRCSSDNACFYGTRRLVLGSLVYSW